MSKVVWRREKLFFKNIKRITPSRAELFSFLFFILWNNLAIR